MRLAAAKEMSMDAAVATVSSELVDVFTLEDEQKMMTLTAFSMCKRRFASLLAGFRVRWAATLAPIP